MLRGRNSNHNQKLIIFSFMITLFVAILVTVSLYLYSLVQHESEIIAASEIDIIRDNSSDSFDSSSEYDEYLNSIKQLACEAERHSPTWSDPMDRYLDFDYLRSINPNICSWIYLPSPYIDMPVLQEHDINNPFYLTHDFADSYNSNGSLFTSVYNQESDNALVLILGNCLGDFSDAMFSPLTQYFCHRDFAIDNPYVYIYYPDHTERWKIYTAANVSSDNMIYNLPYSLKSENYSKLLRTVSADSNYELRDKPSNKRRLLALSTINDSAGKQSRFTITYLKDAEIKIKQDKDKEKDE